MEEEKKVPKKETNSLNKTENKTENKTQKKSVKQEIKIEKKEIDTNKTKKVDSSSNISVLKSIKGATLPNKLIFVRLGIAILMIVIFLFVKFSVGEENFTFEINGKPISYLNIPLLILFIASIITDYLDGKIARKTNKITNFGKLFDPIADKIVVNTCLIFFVELNYIPALLAVLFISRDIMVGGLRMLIASKGEVIAADRFGKYKTGFQFFGISLLFIFHPILMGGYNFDQIGWDYLTLIPIYIALFFSIFSGVLYFIRYRKLVFSDM